MEYDSLLIENFEYFELYLHSNQYYLGRTYLWVKREGLINFFEMNEGEIKEFHLIGRKVTQTIDHLFTSDLFNYASLGNITPHLHIHFIPRYQTKRSFGGIDFIDEHYGQNYAPYDKEFDIPFSVKEALINKIRGALCHTTKESR